MYDRLLLVSDSSARCANQSFCSLYLAFNPTAMSAINILGSLAQSFTFS